MSHTQDPRPARRKTPTASQQSPEDHHQTVALLMVARYSLPGCFPLTRATATKEDPAPVAAATAAAAGTQQQGERSSSRQNPAAGRTQQQQQEESNKSKNRTAEALVHNVWHLQVLNYRTVKRHVWHAKTMQLSGNR